MVDWRTMDGGGGTSAGGVHVMSGYIGQADASGEMNQYFIGGCPSVC